MISGSGSRGRTREIMVIPVRVRRGSAGPTRAIKVPVDANIPLSAQQQTIARAISAKLADELSSDVNALSIIEEIGEAGPTPRSRLVFHAVSGRGSAKLVDMRTPADIRRELGNDFIIEVEPHSEVGNTWRGPRP